MATINFKSHQQALSRMSPRHIQLVKLCHDILPTAKVTNRYSLIAPKTCPLCILETDDLSHLLRCNHPDWKLWRHKLYSALRITFEIYHTRPYPADILLNGLDCWFTGTALVTSKYPRLFYRLITEQTLISWRQIFQGRMSTEWARMQNLHLRKINACSNSNTGTLWTKNIITTVWKTFFIMWEARNSVVHGDDPGTHKKARREHAALSIHHLHSKRDEVLATDTNLFISDTTEGLDHWVNTHTATYVENWLKIWKPVLLDSAKAAQAFTTCSVRPLREYFSPIYTPPTSRRPPKPRYKTNAHTIHDRHKPRTKKKFTRPTRNHSILASFQRQTPTTTIDTGQALQPSPATTKLPDTPFLDLSTSK
jgi:hypothetical protein